MYQDRSEEDKKRYNIDLEAETRANGGKKLLTANQRKDKLVKLDILQKQ